jgi:hypothetical protein
MFNVKFNLKINPIEVVQHSLFGVGCLTIGVRFPGRAGSYLFATLAPTPPPPVSHLPIQSVPSKLLKW